MDATTADTPDAIRSKRYRSRRKAGVRVVRIRVSAELLRALQDHGFLPAGQSGAVEIEAAVYAMANAVVASGLGKR